MSNFYTAGIMTKKKYSDIVKLERKADLRVCPQKGKIQMNTTMIFDSLKSERYDEALDSKQGLVFMYTFLRERNHRIPEKEEIRIVTI